MIIGLDFDGTLATWPVGVAKNYNDARYAICYANAIYPSIVFVKREKANGHEFVLITGRGVNHRQELQAWCVEMLGFQVPIICRPSTVGLSHSSQAAWKAGMMERSNIRIYYGDNERIDHAAALEAKVRFIHVDSIINQFLT
jgi:acid phosphatase class B